MRTKDRDTGTPVAIEIPNVSGTAALVHGISRSGIKWTMVKDAGLGSYQYILDVGVTIISIAHSIGVLPLVTASNFAAPNIFRIYSSNSAGNWADSSHSVVCTVLDKRL